jgi:hypothetical protein
MLSNSLINYPNDYPLAFSDVHCQKKYLLFLKISYHYYILYLKQKVMGRSKPPIFFEKARTAYDEKTIGGKQRERHRGDVINLLTKIIGD